MDKLKSGGAHKFGVETECTSRKSAYCGQNRKTSTDVCRERNSGDAGASSFFLKNAMLRVGGKDKMFVPVRGGFLDKIFQKEVLRDGLDGFAGFGDDIKDCFGEIDLLQKLCNGIRVGRVAMKY